MFSLSKMILSFLPILIAFIAHFRLFSCLSPKGEKLTDKTEKEIPLQINPSHSFRIKNVLTAFDRWLFDEPMNGDIETIVETMDHLHGNIGKGTVLESEEERKATNGIGQMLRMAQRKTFGQIAEERKEKEHALWERLRRRVEEVQKKNLFLANTLAIWAERMPFLVKRLSDQKVGTENCDKLVKAIESLCECLIDLKFPSWKSFCEELSKLKDKEQKQWDERIARSNRTEEKMHGIFPSPRGDGIWSGAITSPLNEKMPNLEIAVSPEGTSKVPTLDLNASQFMRKRLAKSGEQQKTHKTELKVTLEAELNVPTLDLNAAQLSMKRLTEKNKGKFTTAEEAKNEKKEKQ